MRRTKGPSSPCTRLKTLALDLKRRGQKEEKERFYIYLDVTHTYLYIYIVIITIIIINQWDIVPVVPHKAVAEVSKIGTYRSGWLL